MQLWSGQLSMQIARTLADSPQPGRRCHGGFESEHKLLGLIAGGLIGTMALAQPLGAEELGLHGKNHPSETYLELIGYVQQAGDEQPSIVSPHQSPHNFTPIDDETYSALRNFVQNIGAEQAEPPARAARRTTHRQPIRPIWHCAILCGRSGASNLCRTKANSFCSLQPSSPKRRAPQRRRRRPSR